MSVVMESILGYMEELVLSNDDSKELRNLSHVLGNLRKVYCYPESVKHIEGLLEIIEIKRDADVNSVEIDLTKISPEVYVKRVLDKILAKKTPILITGESSLQLKLSLLDENPRLEYLIFTRRESIPNIHVIVETEAVKSIFQINPSVPIVNVALKSKDNLTSLVYKKKSVYFRLKTIPKGLEQIIGDTDYIFG